MEAFFASSKKPATLLSSCLCANCESLFVNFGLIKSDRVKFVEMLRGSKGAPILFTITTAGVNRLVYCCDVCQSDHQIQVLDFGRFRMLMTKPSQSMNVLSAVPIRRSPFVLIANLLRMLSTWVRLFFGKLEASLDHRRSSARWFRRWIISLNHKQRVEIGAL